MKFEISDRVRITQHKYDQYPDGLILGDDVWLLVANKDSEGVVVTFKEYSEFILQQNERKIIAIPNLQEYFQGYLSAVKEEIAQNKLIPIRLEKIAPLDSSTIILLGREETRLYVGRISLVEPAILQKMPRPSLD